jgi:hypothetical protein
MPSPLEPARRLAACALTEPPCIIIAAPMAITYASAELFK